MYVYVYVCIYIYIYIYTHIIIYVHIIIREVSFHESCWADGCAASDATPIPTTRTAYRTPETSQRACVWIRNVCITQRHLLTAHVSLGARYARCMISCWLQCAPCWGFGLTHRPPKGDPKRGIRKGGSGNNNHMKWLNFDFPFMLNCLFVGSNLFGSPLGEQVTYGYDLRARGSKGVKSQKTLGVMLVAAWNGWMF